MSDLSETYKAMKDVSKVKRAHNREQSAALLSAEGIVFTTNNDGVHLIIEGRTHFIDFWPGTGKWRSRCGVKGFGVRNLIQFIKGETK